VARPVRPIPAAVAFVAVLAPGLPDGPAGITADDALAAPGVRVYTKRNPPRRPTLAPLPRLSRVTKDGITWRFSRRVRVGRFITGDYYVVGPVTITRISPRPANGRNGSVKNLPPVNGETGFDSRTDGNRYEPKLRRNPPSDSCPAIRSSPRSASVASGGSNGGSSTAPPEAPCARSRSSPACGGRSLRTPSARHTSVVGRTCSSRATSATAFCAGSRAARERRRSPNTSGTSAGRGSIPSTSTSTRPSGTCPTTRARSRGRSAARRFSSR
jgi:hypothetical protein